MDGENNTVLAAIHHPHSRQTGYSLLLLADNMATPLLLADNMATPSPPS
jgi:hypothetical protein